MSTVAKILIVVNLILAGAFLASASNFLGQQENWKYRFDVAETKHKADLKEKDQQIQDLKDQLNALDRQWRELSAQSQRITTQNQALSMQNDVLSQKHKEASQQLTSATLALKQAQETIKSQRDLVANLQAERNTNLDAVRTAQAAKEAAVRQLNEKVVQMDSLLAQKQDLESQVESLKQRVNSLELSRENAVAMLPEGADVPMEQPAQTGRVLAVDNNLAVISLGSEDGVKIGFHYTVSRGGKYVGQIEITQVEAKMSSGRAVQTMQAQPVQIGDRVTNP